MIFRYSVDKLHLVPCEITIWLFLYSLHQDSKIYGGMVLTSPVSTTRYSLSVTPKRP